MKKVDARQLSPEAQEAIRIRAVEAVSGGMSKTDAARIFDVSRRAVTDWVKKYKTGGQRALKAQKKGAPKRIALANWQAATTVRMITDKCPDQIKLPYALWTRQAVQELIRDRFNIELSKWTIGRYLKRWGLTPQKPIKKAYEKDPQKVEKWLKEEYPAIKQRAQKEKAEIFWGDEMGIRSDHQTGRSYSKAGVTPVIERTGQRFGCNMISAITNRGKLNFMLFARKFTADVLIDFMRRLVRQTPHKVFLILDNHPVHRSVAAKKWLRKHSDEIELFFLPSYSPELNPDELLNQDVKTNAVGKHRAKNKIELMSTVRSFLYSKQKRPKVVAKFFHGKYVSYAST